MRVVVIPGDETGCGTYRMILPANAVMKARPDWKIELYKPGTVKIGSDQQGKLLGVTGLHDPPGIDVLVMQRIGGCKQLDFTSWARDHGIATVVDADDAMWCIDKDNMAYRPWNSQKQHWRFLDVATDLADLVTVTTDHLARRYGKHGRVEIIPNYIPDEVFDYDTTTTTHDGSDAVALGWTGFVATHPRDLTVVGDAVRRAVEETGAVCRIIGDAAGAAEAWDVDNIEWIKPQPLGPAYFKAMATIDIGLVPLADTAFNRAKSWLKALEFSAMGVPVIASPTPNNVLLSKQIPILLASTPDEWYAHLRWLIDHPFRREEQGAEARSIVKANFTVESSGETWAQAWERAHVRRGRMVA